MEKEPRAAGPIDLDWRKLIGDSDDDDDEEPPQVVVVPNSQQQFEMDVEEQNQPNLQSMSDEKLLGDLARLRKNSGIMEKLKDRGEKYMTNIRRHEAEWKRRQQLHGQKIDDDGYKKPTELQDQNRAGESDGVLVRASTAPPSTRSIFASRFYKKLEGKTGSTTANAFGKELSTLNRCNGVMQSDKQCISRVTRKRLLSSRESPFRSPGSPSLNVDDQPPLSGYQKDRSPTAASLCPSEQDMSGFFGRRKTAPGGQISNRLKRSKGETVVLVDEEELEVAETKPQTKEVHECFSKKTSIYYPSRDDPGSVEICYSDMDCLAPEAYLSSTIMNFYIRYLQEQGLTLKTTDRERNNYHFFNTYFYEKLKEAVAKKNINEKSFSKFRRWWKGVNIFEKAYIFLPIHENLHWSLVIVCIPDKEDRSGPILLHLDSLGLHSSDSIFCNIKSFLKEEWKFLKEGEAQLDLPISDTVWEHLPRRMNERTIEVPQQRNDYDCGLFVLFFMKRFIEEAPQRLKKKDLAMFGRRWFNPAEASRLRLNIRDLLEEKFKSANEENQVLDL